MRKLIGECPSCEQPSVFEILTINNQVEDRVLATCQCKKCLENVLVSFKVQITDYKHIEAKGKEVIDGDSSPHATPPSNDF